MENNKEYHSRLYVVCKKALNGEPLDIGHSMLSVGHSTTIAFEPMEKELSIEHINLPDADTEYAVMNWNSGHFSFEMRGNTFFEKHKLRENNYG